ncbi:NUDIX hydrolase [Piscibacillus sp. B03]|uniref:NUDIX hydrolase n=1 Tax=Piscibacillus sp. B03 TaxID=3457430 RepID=UPI003FCD3B71
MSKWKGAAAVCVNEKQELLMIYQGLPHEVKMWSVPSGGVEEGETFEDCCVREVYEETGYHVNVVDELFVKESDLAVVKYFRVKVTGGEKTLHDPDGLVQKVEWRDVELVPDEDFQYKEDIEFLRNYAKEIVT